METPRSLPNPSSYYVSSALSSRYHCDGYHSYAGMVLPHTIAAFGSSYNPSVCVSCPAMSDLFADACCDIDCDAPPIDSAHANADDGIVEQLSVPIPQVARGRGRPRMSQPGCGSKPKRKRVESKARPSCKLAKLDYNLEGNEITTIFVAPGCKPTLVTPRKQTSARADPVPVPIWPQYTVPEAKGRFVIVSCSEQWVRLLLSTVRVRNETQSRILEPLFMHAVRVLFREGRARTLSLLGAPPCDSSDDDEDAFATRKVARSTFKVSKVLLISMELAGRRFTAVNYGKVFILQLDDVGIKFIETTLVDTIRELTVSGTNPTAINAPNPNVFRFDDFTPNVRDKVIWDPDTNSWSLKLLKTKRPGHDRYTSPLVDCCP